MFLRVCVPACVFLRVCVHRDGGLKRGKVKDSLKEEQQKKYSSFITGHSATEDTDTQDWGDISGHMLIFYSPACSGVLSPAGVSIRQRSRCVFEKDVLSLHSFMEQWKPLTSDVCFYFTTVLNMSLCQCEFKRRWRHRIRWWRGFRTTVNINVNINH